MSFRSRTCSVANWRLCVTRDSILENQRKASSVNAKEEVSIRTSWKSFLPRFQLAIRSSVSSRRSSQGPWSSTPRTTAGFRIPIGCHSRQVTIRTSSCHVQVCICGESDYYYSCFLVRRLSVETLVRSQPAVTCQLPKALLPTWM